MIRYIVRFILALVMVVGLTGCVRFVQPSKICGTWRAIHEDWTILDNGVKTNVSYDYGRTPTDESVFMRLSKAGFDSIFATTETKSLTMVYSDRFSAVDSRTSQRIPTQKSVTWSRGKITGSDDEIWKVTTFQDNRMEVSYNSGVIAQDGGGELQRIGSFVLVRQ